MAAEAPALSLWAEVAVLARLGLPAAVLSALRTAQLITDQAILGHLQLGGAPTPLYLDAAAQALLWMNLTLAAVQRGLCTGLNVLTSQALGAGNMQLVGVWLQTAGFALCLGAILVAGLWLLTAPLLGIVSNEAGDGEHDAVALAGRYATLSLGWILPTLLVAGLNTWLIAQRVTRLQLAVYPAMLAVNLGLNVLLVSGAARWGGLGFDGSPLATTATRALQLAALASLARAYGPPLPRATVCHEALRHPRPAEFARQALPSVAGAAVEEVALQVVGGLAARLGEVEMATHTSLLNSFFWLTAPMYGLTIAAAQRIGFYLGAGKPRAARRVAMCVYGVALLISLTVAALLLLLRYQLGAVFSDDANVVAAVASITPLVAAAYTLIGLFYASMATLEGQGRQLPVALAYLLGAFLIAPSSGYVLAFVAGCCGSLQLYGLWFGLIAGYTATTLIACIAVACSDWEGLSAAAVKRSEAAGSAAPGQAAWGEAVCEPEPAQPLPQAEGGRTTLRAPLLEGASDSAGGGAGGNTSGAAET